MSGLHRWSAVSLRLDPHLEVVVQEPATCPDCATTPRGPCGCRDHGHVMRPARTRVPDPSGARDTQREAALQALRRQAAPARPPGAAAVLADRILLHTSWDTAHD